MKKRNNLGVFVAAGAGTPIDSHKELLEQARVIGEFLGKNGYTFIQGASKNGVMGATYNEFIKHSSDVILHLWEIFAKDEYIVKGIIHKSLNLRLEGFLKDTDVLVVFPGSNGTVHEFCTFFEYARYNKHIAKIILINFDGYYDDLINHYKKQAEWGLIKKGVFASCCSVVSNVYEAIEILKRIKFKPTTKLL